jgi:hypothetical protein
MILGVIIIKLRKWSVIFLSVFSLAACTPDTWITSKATPDYKLTQNEEQPVAQKPFLANILKSEDNEESYTNSNKSISHAPNQPNEKDRITVSVTKVVDGDTIHYFEPHLGTKVTGRLLGINGPEYTKEKELYGKESTSFLTNLILDKEIEIGI